MKEHYVYACYVNGNIKYIGMGKGSRYKHCLSGKSSCIDLNKDFFNGEDMRTVIIKDKLTRDDALHLESSMISDTGIDNLYNISLGKVDELLYRSLSLISELWCEVTKYNQIHHTDVRDILFGLMNKYKNPIAEISSVDKIIKILELFGYSHDEFIFTRETETDQNEIMSFFKSKLIK